MQRFRESKRAWKERALKDRRFWEIYRPVTGLDYYGQRYKTSRRKKTRWGRLDWKMKQNRSRMMDILRKYCHNTSITFREWNSMIDQGALGDIAGATKRMWELEKRTEYNADR